ESIRHPEVMSRTLREYSYLFCAVSITAFFHVSSGLNEVVREAILVVSLPRSFSYTAPSWLIRNVVMPEFSYSAGQAISAKPPIILPSTMKLCAQPGAFEP